MIFIHVSFCLLLITLGRYGRIHDFVINMLSHTTYELYVEHSICETYISYFQFCFLMFLVMYLHNVFQFALAIYMGYAFNYILSSIWCSVPVHFGDVYELCVPIYFGLVFGCFVPKQFGNLFWILRSNIYCHVFGRFVLVYSCHLFWILCSHILFLYILVMYFWYHFPIHLKTFIVLQMNRITPQHCSMVIINCT